MTETVTVLVDGMDCTGCEQRIGTALRRIEGIGTVAADHTSGRIQVSFDPDQTTRGAVLDRITLAGFAVRGHDAKEQDTR